MDVGALAVAVEDHDEFGRAVDGREGVRRHGGELGCLSGLDDDLAFAEQQAHPSRDDEEPSEASAVLPMPASPASRTTPPAPPAAASTAERSAPMASRLPTSISAGTPID